LKTKHLGGTIHEGGNEPLEVKLSLRRLVSYDEAASAVIAKDGSFDFADVPPGLYFLRVKARGDSSTPGYGDIPVFVGQSATAEQLSIVVGFTDCGLSYYLRLAPEHGPATQLKNPSRPD
jgi:hypothetical protein